MRKNFWMAVLVLGLAMGSGVCWGMGSRGGDPPPANAEKTSLQLIAEAVEAGELEPDRAVEYRVYAALDEEKLPQQYRGGRPMRDATGVLRQARGRFPELEPDAQERLRPYLFPRGSQ